MCFQYVNIKAAEIGKTVQKTLKKMQSQVGYSFSL